LILQEEHIDTLLDQYCLLSVACTTDTVQVEARFERNGAHGRESHLFDQVIPNPAYFSIVPSKYLVHWAYQPF
jgi:hypothetical protein